MKNYYLKVLKARRQNKRLAENNHEQNQSK